MKLLLVCIAVLYFSVVLFAVIQPAKAQDNSSPAFSRQIESDELDDLEPIPDKCFATSTLPEIRAASYFSNGKVLNATLWLSNPVNETTVPSYFLPRYSIILDVNPASDVIEGNKVNLVHDLDYQVMFMPDRDEQMWQQQIHELSNARATRALTVFTFNQTDVLDESMPYLKLSLDLALVNFPQTYSITFLAEYITFVGNEKCVMADLTTPPAYIPKPKFNLAISPPLISIRPSETAEAELTLNSTLQFPFNATLTYLNQSDLKIGFKPDKLRILPNSIGISRMTINATANPALKLIHSFPVTAHITFPTIPVEQILTQAPQLGSRGGELSNDLNNTASNNVTRDLILPRIVNSTGLAQELSNDLNNTASNNVTRDLILPRIASIKSFASAYYIENLSPEDLGSMLDQEFTNVSLDKSSVQRTFHVSVLSPVTVTEHFVNFWTGWGGFIGLIAGTFVGIAGFLFSRRKER